MYIFVHEPNLYQGQVFRLWSGASCSLQLLLRFAYNLTVVHLWQIGFTGHSLEKHSSHFMSGQKTNHDVQETLETSVIKL